MHSSGPASPHRMQKFFISVFAGQLHSTDNRLHTLVLAAPHKWAGIRHFCQRCNLLAPAYKKPLCLYLCQKLWVWEYVHLCSSVGPAFCVCVLVRGFKTMASIGLWRILVEPACSWKWHAK